MANSTLAVRILPEVERTLAYTGISGTYAAVGTPLKFAAIQVILQNLTDGLVSFSWDGTNSAITLAANTSFILDIQSNKGRADAMMVSENTQFWVSTSATLHSGAIYISALYGAEFANK